MFKLGSEKAEKLAEKAKTQSEKMGKVKNSGDFLSSFLLRRLKQNLKKLLRNKKHRSQL